MGAKKATTPKSFDYFDPPSMSEEAREQQMINLAVNEAEYQLRNHTASSQVITHYLKLGTQKEKREREKLEEEIKLLRAKTEELQAVKNTQQLYAEAISAFGIYSGKDEGDQNNEYEN